MEESWSTVVTIYISELCHWHNRCMWNIEVYATSKKTRGVSVAAFLRPPYFWNVESMYYSLLDQSTQEVFFSSLTIVLNCWNRTQRTPSQSKQSSEENSWCTFQIFHEVLSPRRTNWILWHGLNTEKKLGLRKPHPSLGYVLVRYGERSIWRRTRCLDFLSSKAKQINPNLEVHSKYYRG